MPPIPRNHPVLDTEMSERVRQLLDHVSREKPVWATEVGARPEDRLRARLWHENVSLAAAYRETYAITATGMTTVTWVTNATPPGRPGTHRA